MLADNKPPGNLPQGIMSQETLPISNIITSNNTTGNIPPCVVGGQQVTLKKVTQQITLQKITQITQHAGR